MTGDNGPLFGRLLVEQIRRGIKDEPAWVTAGYCIDAPSEIPAGSTERYEFGPHKDEWVACETSTPRSVLGDAE